MKKKIQEYFRTFDNADVFICGCGCNSELDICHGLVRRIEKDIMKILETFPDRQPKKKGIIITKITEVTEENLNEL